MHTNLWPELLSKILNPGIFEVFQDIKEGMIGDAVDALHNYMDRTDLLHPSGSQQIVSSPPGIDSQGSLDFGSSDIERNMMIYVCCYRSCSGIAILTSIALA